MTSEPAPPLPFWITVASKKGGVGKSTSAVYCAQGFSACGRVLLIDADRQQTALRWWHEADLPFDALALPLSSLHRRAGGLGSGYQTVIVDTPPGDEEVLASAMRPASLVIVPCAPTLLDLNRIEATIALARDTAPVRLSGEPPALRVLLTRTRAGTRSRVAARSAVADLGVELFETEIPQRESYALAGDAPISDLGAYADLLQEISALACALRAADAEAGAA